jgi:uncharacterized protein (TIGR00725 family)
MHPMQTPTSPPASGPYIAVVGPNSAAPGSDIYELAREIGLELARQGAVVICGGMYGVMEGVALGASQQTPPGLCVGILPGDDSGPGNQYLSIALHTALGESRNSVIVNSCQAMISVGGSWGTMNEISLGMRLNKPVVCLEGWSVLDEEDNPVEGCLVAQSASTAVAMALDSIGATAGQGLRPPNGNPTSPAVTPSQIQSQSIEHVWRAYESAIKHYERDLDLFTSRMNLFLAINSALFAAASGVFDGSMPNLHRETTLGVAGFCLAVMWLLVAVSSYAWILEWRRRVMVLGDEIGLRTGVSLATDAFKKSSGPGGISRLIWSIRPTTVSVALPVFFAGMWIYIAWIS